MRAHTGEKIEVKFIETERILEELTEGSIFLTLYADDFVDSKVNSSQSFYQKINARYRLLMVRVIQKINQL